MCRQAELVVEQFSMIARQIGFAPELSAALDQRLEFPIALFVDCAHILDAREALAERRGHRLGQRLAGEFCEALRECMGLRVLDVEGHFYLVSSLSLPYTKAAPLQSIIDVDYEDDH